MIQRAGYYLLRMYVRAGLYFYFRKIIIHGRDNIPSGPVIFAANHQNAFMDALIIACFNDHFTYFLTRADIFKRAFIRWMITSLNMIPVYRIRDGWQSLAENQKTFDSCKQLFLQNEAVGIFPEGNHGSQRRLRLLTKGFARLAFETLHHYPELKISIVPVGINYSDHQAFRSSVSIYFGEPILANDYFHEPIQREATHLRDELAARMKRLTTHVEDVDRYSEIIQKLETSNPNYLDPADTNKRISKIERGEGMTRPPLRPKRNAWGLLPFHYVAVAINFIPRYAWRKIKMRIKDPVFVTSIRFGVGIFVFPFFYLLIGLLVSMWYGPTIALSWCAVSFPSALFLKR